MVERIRASVNAQMCASDAQQSKIMHYNHIYYVTTAHNKSSHKHINVMQRTKHEQIHTGWPQFIVSKALVTVICNQLSNIPYIFRYCDLLVLNKSHEKKKKTLQVKNKSFTDCDTEGLLMKAN